MSIWYTTMLNITHPAESEATTDQELTRTIRQMAEQVRYLHHVFANGSTEDFRRLEGAGLLLWLEQMSRLYELFAGRLLDIHDPRPFPSRIRRLAIATADWSTGHNKERQLETAIPDDGHGHA